MLTISIIIVLLFFGVQCFGKRAWNTFLESLKNRKSQLKVAAIKHMCVRRFRGRRTAEIYGVFFGSFCLFSFFPLWVRADAFHDRTAAAVRLVRLKWRGKTNGLSARDYYSNGVDSAVAAAIITTCQCPPVHPR